MGGVLVYEKYLISLLYHPIAAEKLSDYAIRHFAKIKLFWRLRRDFFFLCGYGSLHKNLWLSGFFFYFFPFLLYCHFPCAAIGKGADREYTLCWRGII